MGQAGFEVISSQPALPNLTMIKTIATLLIVCLAGANAFFGGYGYGHGMGYGMGGHSTTMVHHRRHAMPMGLYGMGFGGMGGYGGLYGGYGMGGFGGYGGYGGYGGW